MNKLWQGLRRRISSDPNTHPASNAPMSESQMPDSYFAAAVNLPGTTPIEAVAYALRAYRYPVRLYVSADSSYLLGLAIGSDKGTLILTPVQATDIGALDIPWNSLYTPSILRQQMDDGAAIAMRVAAVVVDGMADGTEPPFKVIAAPENVPNGPQWVTERFRAGRDTNGVNEYIIADGWRRRSDVAQIVETRARYHRQALIEGMAALAAWRGYGGIVVGNEELANHLRYYYSIGFTDLEQVIYYEKPDMNLPAAPQVRLHLPNGGTSDEPGLQLETRPLDPAHLEQTDAAGVNNLLRLQIVDNAAFPWLWWNSTTELRHYVFQPDVTLYEAFIHPLDDSTSKAENAWDWNAPVGYFSFTRYERWAHLDRLAIAPQWQGRNIGAHLLDYSLRLMAQANARRVSLSTQSTNHRSQRLYEGYGFRRVRSLEYNIVGRWLRPERAAAHASMR